MFAQIGHVARPATVLLLAAAILAPTAGAGRYGPGRTPGVALIRQESRPATTCHQYCGAGVPGRSSRAPAGRAVVRTELVPSSDAGFHWADAALGFAVACGGILLVFLAVAAGRRTRFRPAGGES